MATRAPAALQLAGMVVAVGAVLMYAGYTHIELQGLRRLQTETVERNRRNTQALLRLQGALQEIGLALRDMEREGEGARLREYRGRLERLRGEMNGVLGQEAGAAPGMGAAGEWQRLGESSGRFWKEMEKVWPLGEPGRENEARALIRTGLEKERAALAEVVSRLLAGSEEAEAGAQAEISGIYRRVELNLYWLLGAVLAAMAATSIYVIEGNRRALVEIERLSEQRRVLAGQVISVQEELFRTLARELHDDFGQVLTAMGVMLQRAAKRLEAGSLTQEDLREVREVAHQTLEKVRALSQMLHPPVLDDYGLERSIEWYTGKCAKQTGMTIHYEKIGIGPWIGDEIAIHMYRILQEALNNVVRHAGTREAWVRVRYEPHRMELVVEDHGKGMSGQPAGSGIGMIAMRERTGLLNGEIAFTAPPEGGTRVVVRIPLTVGESADE